LERSAFAKHRCVTSTIRIGIDGVHVLENLDAYTRRRCTNSATGPLALAA